MELSRPFFFGSGIAGGKDVPPAVRSSRIKYLSRFSLSRPVYKMGFPTYAGYQCYVGSLPT
jgi:hypothetical protein